MKRPYRFIISFDVFIASAVFLKARELDFSKVLEARQGISESLKRLTAQNTIAAGVTHFDEMAIERVKGEQKVGFCYAVHQAKEAVEDGARHLLPRLKGRHISPGVTTNEVVEQNAV